MLAKRSTAGLAAPRLQRTTAARVVCQAYKPESVAQKLALPVASVVTSLMLLGAAVPEEALAAKSSGRVGGSSGFAARKAPAPVQSRSSSATSSRTVVNNTTVVVAPPVVSPFGFGGFGFGGFGFGLPVFMPVPIFGGIFQLFAVLILASVVFGVIRSFTSGGNDNKNKKDDGWGDL